MDLRGRDYIATQDFDAGEIQFLIDRSSELKAQFKAEEPHRTLADKTIFLFFFDKSTRTRNSFEAGATQLGAHARVRMAARAGEHREGFRQQAVAGQDEVASRRSCQPNRPRSSGRATRDRCPR